MTRVYETTTTEDNCRLYALHWQQTAAVLRGHGDEASALVADSWGRHWLALADKAPPADHQIAV